jgi:hypothetical protein
MFYRKSGVRIRVVGNSSECRVYAIEGARGMRSKKG